MLFAGTNHPFLFDKSSITSLKDGNIKRGENYGKINLGSRVDILLPLNYTTNLQIGQKVLAGITKIIQ